VAAQLDAEVTVIDRDGLAGSAVLTDCVPSKTLIATAELMTSIEESRELGVGSAHQNQRSIMLPLAGNSRAKMRVSTMVRQGVLPARYGDCRRQRCRRERELIHLIAGGRRRSRAGVHGQSVVSGSVVLSPVERLRP
jgi:hypothetical protein